MVHYNIIYKLDKEKTKEEIEEIITKKLLKVILNLENINGLYLNNKDYEV